MTTVHTSASNTSGRSAKPAAVLLGKGGDTVILDEPGSKGFKLHRELQDYLEQRFCVIDGPLTAYYETLDGRMLWPEDYEAMEREGGGEGNAPDIDEPRWDRSVYVVFGFAVTDEGEYPVPTHGRALWVIATQALEKIRDECLGTGSVPHSMPNLVYVQRAQVAVSVDEFPVYDEAAPSYNYDQLLRHKRAHEQASAARDKLRSLGLVPDAWVEAHVRPELDRYAEDFDSGSWRLVLRSYTRTKVTWRGHFRGLASATKAPGFLPEGCKIVNVVMPLDAFKQPIVIDGRTVEPMTVTADLDKKTVTTSGIVPQTLEEATKGPQVDAAWAACISETEWRKQQTNQDTKG